MFVRRLRLLRVGPRPLLVVSEFSAPWVGGVPTVLGYVSFSGRRVWALDTPVSDWRLRPPYVCPEVDEAVLSAVYLSPYRRWEMVAALLRVALRVARGL